MNIAANAYQDILNRLKQREDLLRILIFTVFTAFCWVGFSIFLSQKKTKIAPEVQKYAIPLNPNINRATVDDIVSRKTFTESELQDFPIVPPPDETGIQKKSPTPVIATSSATPKSATASATP